ncbi:hypothetical protein [Mycobacterium colombiense]|uniref:hypothetical protein n=1 Tax=Mycobacterium colombiense TaxID=339268 RepID=UPI00197B1498|nr:hypothetical protein [Mycobacterium colombiense]
MAVAGRSAISHIQYDNAVVTIAPRIIETPKVAASQGLPRLMSTKIALAVDHTAPWTTAILLGIAKTTRRKVASLASAGRLIHK